MKLITKGAEANIYEKDGIIIKERIPKKYRIKEIDEKINKSRTNREAKVIKKLNEAKINSPTIIKKENNIIIMELIKGFKLRDVIEEKDYKKISKEIGKNIKKIHDLGIIHGDLTTSNIILKDNQIYLIDFGLSFFSHKDEDKAVDLHLLEEALNSKHHKIAKECFNLILKSYNDKEVINRLIKVKERGRNKTK
jgi:Kae1-associated kinase Bud32